MAATLPRAPARHDAPRLWTGDRLPVYERAMRNMLIALLVAVLAVACGSSAELKAAKTAHYKGDKIAMFNIVKDTTAAKYNLQKADETALGMQTVGRWYTPEGLGASERAGDMRDVPDNSINIALVVTLVPDGDAYVVNVKPLMMRYHAGSPKPEPLTEDDPSVPGWAHGKVDQLALDIHEALKAYEVKQLGGVTPAGPGTPAPAPAPEAGSAAPADQGSAAPADQGSAVDPGAAAGSAS
jgi:hypothetical protein